jgi:hypothetical protein
VWVGARSETGGLPSPKRQRNVVSPGDPTGENRTVSGAGPRQSVAPPSAAPPPVASKAAHPVTEMSILGGKEASEGPASRVPASFGAFVSPLE